MRVSPLHAAANPPRLRLVYLDGIRGLAAVFVVVHHLHQEVTYRGDLPRRVLAMTKWMDLGHFAVGVFIVLSGFSLMIPVVRSTDARIPGGFWDYLKRRARRILPPYYAALILTLLMDLCIPGLRSPGNWRWDQTLPSFRLDVIISHLLLVHNFNREWVYNISAPFWSVATEWQIYFAFPLLLLPVWRRMGAAVMVVTALVVGVGGAALLPQSLGCAASWYLALFAYGMAAAVICFSQHARIVVIRDRIPWGLLTLVSVAALGLGMRRYPGWFALKDCLDGVVAACLLVKLAQQATSTKLHPRSMMLRFFESAPAVTLGAASYSLYLIHSPLISATNLLVNWLFSPTPLARAWIVPAVAIPIIVVSTFAFYRTVEQPLVRRSQTSRSIPRELAPAI
jgi:peptidoglycan/LPS O-acetylase OafA/YrhL